MSTEQGNKRYADFLNSLEERRQPPLVFLTQEDVAQLLYFAALAYDLTPCGGRDDCETCNTFLLWFWNLDAVLDPPMRMEWQGACRKHNVHIPDAPWETVVG